VSASRRLRELERLQDVAILSSDEGVELERLLLARLRGFAGLGRKDVCVQPFSITEAELLWLVGRAASPSSDGAA
jgi:hypothetical protein